MQTLALFLGLVPFAVEKLPEGRPHIVAALGDVDGDGAIELCVGRPRPGTSGPSVGVFSSRDGRLVHWLRLEPPVLAYGSALARWTDFDGDGVDDLAVGAPATGASYPGAGVSGPLHGIVFIHSGRTGALLRRLEGLEDGDAFGYDLAAADLDGDGRAELVVGSPGAGRVCVFAGSDGACTWRFRPVDARWFGASVATLGDLDGDGRSEVLVGAPESGAGSAWVLALAGESVLRRHASLDALVPLPRSPKQTVPSQHATSRTRGARGFGASVAGLGDVDKDHVPDYLVSARGTLHLYSGAKGEELAQLGASESESLEFETLSGAGLGDVDDDGVPDFVFGDPINGESFERWLEGRHWPGSGSVTCVSGRTRRALWTAEGVHDGSSLGSALAAVPDVDHDGRPDLLVEAREDDGYAPSFHVLSGKTGIELCSFSLPGDAAWRVRQGAQR